LKVAVAEAAANSFSAGVKDFITQHAQPRCRGWKQTASTLGLDAELALKSNGLVHRWGDRDVKTIDAHDLHTVVEEARKYSIPSVRAKHDRPSEARARKLYAALSELFGWLQKKRRVDSNPMRNLSPPPPASARDRDLSNAEIREVWSAFGAAKEPFGSVLKLLLLTGGRLNEIARLQWSEVSDDFTLLTIPGARTKNKKVLLVPLAPLARDLVIAQRREGSMPIGPGFVFSTTGGVAPISGWWKIKKKVDAAGGIEPWVAHDLRHTAATGMAAIGILPHIVECVLGHTSGFRSGVAGRYNHYSYYAEKREALEKWAAYITSIVGAGKGGSR
jgi:integrase